MASARVLPRPAMSAATMKLRSDLVISRQDGTEGTIFVLKDPITDRFFRFKETEHFIAQQFDGATSADTVRQRVEERLGVKLTSENLDQFTERLQRIGLLTPAENGATTLPARRRRIGGDVFYLRFRLFDPDRLFDWLMPKVRFLFTPQFVVLSAALVAAAFGITAIHWGGIMHQFWGLFRFESLLLAWFVMLGVVTLHEFAHGLTCKYFGGRVREIGFLLIYFQPAFYCNVSDAWLFPEKSKRLWVTFAGAYFETFLWALATIVWWLTDPHTTTNHLALVVVATSAIKSFFNMNPLIKLDGYYLLSDWLGIPNLRQKAFGYVGHQIKRLWTTANAPCAEVTPRERWIFVVYALLAGTYSYWLFGKILLWAGTYLTWRYQGLGFILFATALGVIFREPLKKLLATITSRLHPRPEEKSEPSKPTGPKFKLPKLTLPKRVWWGLGFAGLMAALFLGRMELKVSGAFTVLPLHNADVRAEVEGIITQIYVEEGDHVNKGDVIARLSDRDFSADLRKTRAEIEAKQAQLKLLKAGARPEEIELAKTLVQKAEERIKYAQSRVGMDKTLFADQLISRREVEETQESLGLRQMEFQEARDRLTVLLAGSRLEEIEATEAEIRRLTAHEHYLQEQFNLLTVVSPTSGVVTTHKPKEKIGERVGRGDLIAEVHELKTVTVEIAIPEKEIAEVRRGQKILLKARAYPQRQFASEVIAIAPIASAEDDPVAGHTVLVTTRLNNADDLLKPSMTGTAKIYCGEHRLWDLVTRRFVRFFRVEFWSWW